MAHPRLMPLVAAVVLVTACDPDRGATPGAPSAGAASASTSPPGDGAPIDDEVETVDDTIPSPTGEEGSGGGAEPEEGCAPEQDGLKPMQVLLFRWTSGIENKDPKDKLFVARPGQRVYAHLRMRNRSGTKRCLRLVFRVGDEKRTEVTLKIGESWNWRTWAYNTLKAEDRQPLRLTIHDDQGALVLDERLPVVPETK